VHRDQSLGYEGDCESDLAGIDHEWRWSVGTLGGTLYVDHTW